MQTKAQTQTANLQTSSRIILAITGKDLLDGLKNKSILTTIFTVLFLMVFYRGMPLLTAAARPPVLVVYDAGSSDLTRMLEESPVFTLRQSDSMEGLAEHLGSETEVLVGLAIPADFDQVASTGDEVVLTGYAAHWASDASIAKIRDTYEVSLSQLLGKPVRLEIRNEIVYTQADGGLASIISLSFALILFMFGLSVAPALMLEEKQTHTMDVLLVSPASSGQVVIAKALAGLAYCLLGSAIVLVFNPAVFVHWGLVVLGVLAGALFHVAVGLLVGMTVKNRQQLGVWTLGLAQPLLLSVGLMPVFGILPGWLRQTIQIIPTVALAKILTAALLVEAPFATYGPALAYLLAWAAILLLAVRWQVRRMDR